MNRGNLKSSQLIKILINIEFGYLHGKINRGELPSVLKEFDFYYRNRVPELNEDVERYSLISIFLILERFKKSLLFENQILTAISSEIQAFTSKLDYFNNFFKEKPSSYMGNGSMDVYEYVNINDVSNGKNGSVLKPRNKRSNYPKKFPEY